MTEEEQKTIQQIDRFIRKVIEKFPDNGESSIMTDIHFRVNQDTGEMLAFDDDDNEITRCVVDEWIENKDDNFYDRILLILRKEFKKMSNDVDKMGILKPFSFVLENEEKNGMGELYVADDDTIILGGDIMENLDSELDDFFDKLMKE